MGRLQQAELSFRPEPGFGQEIPVPFPGKPQQDEQAILVGAVEKMPVGPGVEADGVEAAPRAPGELGHAVKGRVGGKGAEGDAFQKDAAVAEGKETAIDPQARWSGRGHD